MNLKDLKDMKIADLLNLGKDLNVDGARGLRKQDLIFAILQAQTEQNGMIYGEGVLQVLPEGYGFCGLLTPLISQAPMIFMSHQLRFVDLICVPVTPSQAR